MIVSISKKFIFIKTRKCGGTSIQNTLLPYCDKNDFVTLGFDNLITKRISPIEEFSKLSDVRKRLKIDTSDYYKFGFVRNPYSIVLSRYFYQIKMGRIKGPTNKENFNLWCKDVYFKGGLNHNFMSDKYSNFLFDIHNEPIVDFIGKLENLEEDFKVVKTKLNLDTNLTVRKDNISNNNKTHYSEWMSDETKELVKKFFEFELEYFGYTY